MTANGWLQIGFFLLVIFALTKPVGVFMAKVFNGENTFLDFTLRPIERLIYRATGVREEREMAWTEYGTAMLLFSAVSMLVLYMMERTQHWPLFNPQRLANVAPDLAWNTAASFTTNTNWQAYTPETTMSYLTQMAGLAYHNFASAAVGIALAIALIRGVSRNESKTIGNFWVDLTRCFLWVLLPVCLAGSLVLVSQGVVQNLRPYATVRLVEPQTVPAQGPDGKAVTQVVAQQTIAQGPAASQEIIKMFGTNGGGFFNSNSTHPYENPTPFSNFLEMVLIFAIPSALTYTLGRMTGSPRHGWAVWAAMTALFLAGVSVTYWAEARGNPQLTGVNQIPGALQSGGNMEGKETRFGIADTALFATITTDASCGAVNGMHDSFTPLGGLVPLFNIQLGEVVFGGVGAGLYGMLMFAILAVFIAGLMVGRTPEYLGKKIEQKEVKMAMIAMLVLAASILFFTGASSVVDFAKNSYWNPPGPAAANTNNPGAHGLSEILYAYSSATGNNGSAFGGLNPNTPWYNLTIGLAMWIGRFLFLIPLLAAAGSLAGKKKIPSTAGTFPTHGPLFVGLLVGTVIIVGALTFFPALSLGPIVEHYLMHSGKLFSMILLPFQSIWS